MPMVSSDMRNAFSWDESQMGIVFSSLTLMYAVGQFVNGQLADRFGSRLIASLGVLGSVSMNMAIFLVTLLLSPETTNPRTILLLVAVFWGANGFFQAMGWTPMVRIMAHWFSSENRGKVMGLLATCIHFGMAFSWFLAFFISTYYARRMGGDWRAAFWVPAGLFAIVGVIFLVYIRNTPEDVGLPAVEADDHSEWLIAQTLVNPHSSIIGHVGKSQRTIVQNIARTLKNPYIWIVALTFFLLDMNRYGFVNWLPEFLAESGESVGIGGFGFKEVMKRIIHPLAGSAGAITAGWATDRFFNGRRAPVIALLLTLLGVCSIVFPYLDPRSSIDLPDLEGRAQNSYCRLEGAFVYGFKAAFQTCHGSQTTRQGPCRLLGDFGS
jgi:OPA family glycerol-3-phosphate transporter-like MFS transporter